MYKITRSAASEPQILIEKSKEWTEKFLEKRQQNPTHKLSWRKGATNYHDEIVKALGNLTHNHCSYCDKYPLDERGKIDLQIDHFKPISKPEFTRLAYDWTNLFLACGGCNKPKLAQYNDLILRPDADDYNPSHFFFFDTSTGEILVNETKGKEYSARAEETIKVFNLNDKSIIKMRLRAIRNFRREMSNPIEEFDINDYDYRNFIEELLYF